MYEFGGNPLKICVFMRTKNTRTKNKTLVLLNKEESRQEETMYDKAGLVLSFYPFE